MKLKSNILVIIGLFAVFSLTSMNKSKSLVPVKKSESSSITFITEKSGIKEYKLKNGLKILFKVNHSIPLVTFSVWQKAGSRNEKEGEYGLAHFLEHMMFKGTKKIKKGQISEIINNLGGVYNAFTSIDCTVYYETISPKYLEKVIEIESDRFKNSILDENELNLERTVVLSELEGDLNNPITLLDHTLRSKAYEISPYKNPTIGYKDDIKNIDRNKMHSFYSKYYSPNNASIVLVGDFNEAKALGLIDKYFGNIKNENPGNPDDTLRDNPQAKEKHFKVKRAGTFKLVEIAYHTVDAKHRDIYPLNIIEEILIKGNKSRLRKALVEKGFATDISGGAEINADPGLFYILVSLTPKASHAKVKKIILSEIDKLISNPPTEKEINAAKNRIKASYLFGIDGTLQQVLNIGYFEIINNWKQSINWTDEISRVKPEDVENALKIYFKKENRTIGYFVPKIQRGAKYEAQPLSISRSQHYTKPKESSQITNSKTSNSANKFNFTYTKRNLKDGSTIVIYNKNDLPVTYISGVIKGGSSLIPKENELNCEIISRTLEKGSKNYTKDQIEELLDSTGSEVDFSCDEESFKFKAATINENLTETINLLTDLLQNPELTEKEIKNEKEKLIAEIIETKDSPQEIARRRFTQLIYPKDHPYYSNDFDTEIKLIKKIDRESLVKDHEKLVKNNRAIITIVTNLNQKELNRLIKQIEKGLYAGAKKEEVAIKIPDTLLRENTKSDSIVIKDKTQTDVFLGHAGNINRTSPDFYKAHIANYIFGGSSLASRLSKVVRDNSGLVYTVYSYISASYGKGEFIKSGEVAKTWTGSRPWRKMLNKSVEGSGVFTDEELGHGYKNVR